MKFRLDIQMFASKKGVGSTKNGRDSHSKRLGAKLADGQFTNAGSIIYRQRGTKIHPGVNVGRGGRRGVYGAGAVFHTAAQRLFAYGGVDGGARKM